MKYRNRLLSTYPILGEMPNVLNDLENMDINYSMKDGQILKHPHDVCLGFPLILFGKLVVTKISDNGDETFVFYLNPGDVCHHAFRCIVENDAFGIQVKCVSDCELIIVPINYFKENIMGNYKFLRFLYADLFNKFDDVVLNKEHLIHESVEGRLYNFLKEKEGKNIKITHEQIASELGTAREVISRLLKSYERDGKIKLGRGSIEVYKM